MDISSQVHTSIVQSQYLGENSGELLLTNEMFERWQKLIYQTTGIYFRDNRKYLLESRLSKRIKYLNLNSFEDYFEVLSGCSDCNAEKQYFYDVITINETYFFRNQAQLDALVLKILPELIKERSSSGTSELRIWSAATSSGEEAYSIAMIVEEFIKPKYPKVKFEIIGTDISSEVINKAKKGIFSEYSMKQLPAYFIKKYFNPSNGLFEIKQEIKNSVKFEISNLYEEHHYKKRNYFDVILCANVLIYFDNASKLKVVNNLYKSLAEGGYLFIGYSETLHGITNSYKLVSFPKTIAYKKEGRI